SSAAPRSAASWVPTRSASQGSSACTGSTPRCSASRKRTENNTGTGGCHESEPGRPADASLAVDRLHADGRRELRRAGDGGGRSARVGHVRAPPSPVPAPDYRALPVRPAVRLADAQPSECGGQGRGSYRYGGTVSTATTKARPQSRPTHAADAHDVIRVQGARENNLKNITVEIPKRRLTVFTGVSGSGKSSLVFATLAAESQRLMNETYSTFVQGFMPTLPRPDVDVLEGLTP